MAADDLRLDAIVLEAAAHEGEERERYLDQLSVTHPGLLDEVRRLLEAASHLTGSFLDRSPADVLKTGGAPAPDLDVETVRHAPGERYRLERKLGTGGMANVHLAHDEQLARPVALKLLTAKDPDVQRRCLDEARAQARIRHDHVLEVYETGELDGRPFIAMRYVEGTTLLGIRNSTSLEEQVRLVAEAAEGLHAAHRTGLLHRDVKPSNILIEQTDDGASKAWVTDFGIAAELHTGDANARRSIEGTPAFLAPERLHDTGQALDRRSDVFSLGVTLYQLLTGSLPFDDGLVLELLHKIRSEAPHPPRALAPHLPVELEAIVLRCLEKDPDDRYPTAGAVAADLRRFLAGDLVEAHTASLAYRATRFALRHRILLSVVAVATVLLVAALSLASARGVQALRAHAKANLRQSQAEDLLSFLLVDLRQQLEPFGRLDILDKIGDEATTYFAAVPEAELSDQELSRYATALHQIGDVRRHQGKLAAAHTSFQQSLALTQALVARHPNDGDRLFDLGQSHFWVGYVRWKDGDLDGAYAHFETYLALSERLITLDPEREPWQLELAYAHSNLGTVARDRGDFDAAGVHYRRSLATRAQLAAKKPEDLKRQLAVARAHNALGVLLEAAGDAGAREHFEAELALKTELVAAAPDRIPWRDDLAIGHNYLGRWLQPRGQWATARGHLETAVAIYEELVAGDPTNATWRYKLGLNRGALGRTLLALGEHASAMEHIRLFHQALATLVEQDTTRRDWRHGSGVGHLYLGAATNRVRGGAGGRQDLERAIAIFEDLSAHSADDLEARRRLAEGRILLGTLEEGNGDPASARRAWEGAIEAIESVDRGAGDWRVLAPWVLANLRLGREDEASAALHRLRAMEFCDPFYLPICADAPIPTRPSAPGSPAAPGSR